MPSSGILCHVPLVRTDVSEERSASIIKVTIIGGLGTLPDYGDHKFVRNVGSELHGVTSQKTAFFKPETVFIQPPTLITFVRLYTVKRFAPVAMVTLEGINYLGSEMRF
jgi:hypothetical protein